MPTYYKYAPGPGPASYWSQQPPPTGASPHYFEPDHHGSVVTTPETAMLTNTSTYENEKMLAHALEAKLHAQQALMEKLFVAEEQAAAAAAMTSAKFDGVLNDKLAVLKASLDGLKMGLASLATSIAEIKAAQPKIVDIDEEYGDEWLCAISPTQALQLKGDARIDRVTLEPHPTLTGFLLGCAPWDPFDPMWIMSVPSGKEWPRDIDVALHDILLIKDVVVSVVNCRALLVGRDVSMKLAEPETTSSTPGFLASIVEQLTNAKEAGNPYGKVIGTSNATYVGWTMTPAGGATPGTFVMVQK